MAMRYRSAGHVERQQQRWFVLALAVSGTGLAIAALEGTFRTEPTGSIGLTLYVFSGALVPLADRHRHPALPPVRPRPAHQPHLVMVRCHGRHRGDLRATGGRPPGRSRRHHAGRDRRSCPLDDRCRCALPARSAPRPAGGGPSLRPWPLRRGRTVEAFAEQLRDEVDLSRLASDVLGVVDSRCVPRAGRCGSATNGIAPQRTAPP